MFTFGAPIPVIVGHRGAPAEAPENTLPSFLAAAAAGAAWVELDARRSADGQVVVVHDALVAGGSAVVDLPSAVLGEYRVPRLDAVLEALPDGIGVDIELKNLYGEPDYDEEQALARLVADLLRPVLGSRPLLASSFNPVALQALRAELPELPLGLLAVPGLTVSAGLDLAAEFSMDALHPHRSAPDLTAAAVVEAHGRGLPLLVWTVDELEEAVAFAAAGVDAICTNDPQQLFDALRR